MREPILQLFMCDILADCLSISKYFKKYTAEYAVLKVQLNDLGLRFLKLPGETRWGSIRGYVGTAALHAGTSEKPTRR
jgi:hypothetical protein